MDIDKCWISDIGEYTNLQMQVLCVYTILMKVASNTYTTHPYKYLLRRIKYTEWVLCTNT